MHMQDSDKVSSASPSADRTNGADERDEAPGEREEAQGEWAPCVEVEKVDSDATTGASPGTAQACDDLGLNSLEDNLKRLGIKPPGQ